MTMVRTMTIIVISVAMMMMMSSRRKNNKNYAQAGAQVKQSCIKV